MKSKRIRVFFAMACVCLTMLPFAACKNKGSFEDLDPTIKEYALFVGRYCQCADDSCRGRVLDQGRSVMSNLARKAYHYPAGTPEGQFVTEMNHVFNQCRLAAKAGYR